VKFFNHRIFLRPGGIMRKLGINVDHIATLRQARRGSFPDPVIAAGICQIAGCDSIVCHLREDRRHIQDRDVQILKKTVNRLNLEMALSEEIIAIALDVQPAQVTLVPEKREELTTEGGLDVTNNTKRVQEATERFKKRGIVVSLFIEPDFTQIEASAKLGADAIEIHTGRYAATFAEYNQQKLNDELNKIAKAAEYGLSLGLKVHAGHGLDYINIRPLLQITELEEYNIGYSIICRAVFTGLEQAVREMCAILKTP